MVGLMATRGYFDSKTCHFRALKGRHSHRHLAGRGGFFLLDVSNQLF